MFLRTALYLLSFCLLMLVSPLAFGQGSDQGSSQQVRQAQQKEQLAQLQAELVARQQVLKNNKASAEELEGVLKQSELEIAKVAKALSSTKQSLDKIKDEQQALQKEQSELKTAIRQQQALLASQLKSAFMAGHYDYAKMLFYQEDAKSF
ncbi:MAG: peptidase M23, partial [Pseudomonadota bacterium]|nr:peptidase M23 [Pseudomonadota bacterium]